MSRARPDDAGAAAMRRRAALAMSAPYVAWIAFILAFEMAASLSSPMPRAWLAPAYALKSALCLALLLAFRRYRPAPMPESGDARWLLAGALAGVAVLAIWVLPESDFLLRHCRPAALFYRRWLVMPLGAMPPYFDPGATAHLPAGAACLAYSPNEAGWPLAAARLLGSAFVIAPAEEFFFRGFLYRWIRGRDWLSTPLSRFDAQSFWIVVALFAFEHDRWFAGAVAGVAYGFLAVKSGGLAAPIVAHITTNLLLGALVLATGQFGFW